MNRIFIILCFLFIFVSSDLGQNIPKCELKPEQSPEIRGLKLSMTADELKRKFPNLQVPIPDEFGLAHFYIAFFPLPDRFNISYGTENADNHYDTRKFSAFKGWEQLEFELLDNRVVTLKIDYDASVKWNDLSAFTSQMTSLLKLPDSWSEDSLNCDGFRVNAEVFSGKATIQFSSEVAVKTYENRKKEAEEKKRKEFKP